MLLNRSRRKQVVGKLRLRFSSKDTQNKYNDEDPRKERAD